MKLIQIEITYSQKFRTSANLEVSEIATEEDAERMVHDFCTELDLLEADLFGTAEMENIDWSFSSLTNGQDSKADDR